MRLNTKVAYVVHVASAPSSFVKSPSQLVRDALLSTSLDILLRSRASSRLCLCFVPRSLLYSAYPNKPRRERPAMDNHTSHDDCSHLLKVLLPLDADSTTSGSQYHDRPLPVTFQSEGPTRNVTRSMCSGSECSCFTDDISVWT